MSDEAKFAVPAGQRQLFVDGHGVAEEENLVRTLHQPSKKGAVIRPDFTLGRHNVQTRSAPHWNPRLEAYRIVAEGRWYESVDGLHWAPAGADLQPAETVPQAHVLFDPADPDPGRRFKGITSHVVNLDTGRRVQHSSERVDPEGKPWPGKRFDRYLDFLVSPDGIEWSRLDADLSSFDEWNLSYDGLGGQYILCFKKAGTYGRSHMISTSPDFESWSEPVLAIQADDLDQELGRLHIEEFLPVGQRRLSQALSQHAGVALAERGHLQRRRLPLRGHLPGPSGHLPRPRRALEQPHTALHPDPVVVQPRSPQLGAGGGPAGLHPLVADAFRRIRPQQEPASFLSGGARRRALVLLLGPQGVLGPSRPPTPTSGPSAWRCCAATEFVSLDAAGEEGRVLTEPFTVPGKELWVNVDVRRTEVAAGFLRAEVLGDGDEVLAGIGPRGRRPAAGRGPLEGGRHRRGRGQGGAPALHPEGGALLLILVRVRCPGS